MTKSSNYNYTFGKSLLKCLGIAHVFCLLVYVREITPDMLLKYQWKSQHEFEGIHSSYTMSHQQIVYVSRERQLDEKLERNLRWKNLNGLYHIQNLDTSQFEITKPAFNRSAWRTHTSINESHTLTAHTQISHALPTIARTMYLQVLLYDSSCHQCMNWW